MGDFVYTHLVWPIKRVLVYDLYHPAGRFIIYHAIPAIVHRLPRLRGPIEAWFRTVRGYVACLRCGHTFATCGFRGVMFPMTFLTAARDPQHSIWSDHWFLCYCCWPETSPAERRVYARAAAESSREREDILDPVAWAFIVAGCDDERILGPYAHPEALAEENLH